MLQWTWGCTYHFKTVLWFPSWLRILWYIPRGGTAGSYGSSSFSFFEETFHSGGTNLHPQFLGCSFYFSFFFFCTAPHSMWDLNSLPGIKPTPLAVEAQSLNNCTAREVHGGNPHIHGIIPSIQLHTPLFFSWASRLCTFFVLLSSRLDEKFLWKSSILA